MDDIQEELILLMRSKHLAVEGLTESPQHVETFLELSNNNRTVESVSLRLSTISQDGPFRLWEKVGKAIGNLEALQEIDLILNEPYPPFADWYTSSYVLSFLRHKIKLRFGDCQRWNEVEMQHFATAIRHNPFIKAIEQKGDIPTTCFYIFVNVLATLPALEEVTLCGFAQRHPLKASTMVSMQMQVLLQSRSLRSLTLDSCCITREIVQCLTSALNGSGSTLTCLRLIQCDYLDEGPGSKDIANALQTNTSLTHFQYVANSNTTQDAFIVEMQQVLRFNTTLKDLDLCFLADDDCDASPRIIAALGDNMMLKKCRFFMDDFEDRDLYEAMRISLERNSTLECLTLECLIMQWDDEIDMHNGGFARLRETVSFLRINASLKSLRLVCNKTAAHDVGPLCIETVSTLAVNTSLENLEIDGKNDSKISSLDYLAALEALGPNTALKTLRLHPNLDSFDSDQVKELLSLIRKNYGLESLDDGLPDPTGELGYILRLNKAGRRYILRDPSSISGSIGVFAGISDDVNCVLVHMLENPRLCDRRALKMVGAGENKSSSTNPTAGSDGGKRERASVHEGKVSHRRLA
jgi:hypothetical protein